MPDEPRQPIGIFSTFVSLPLVKAATTVGVVFVLGWQTNAFFNGMRDSMAKMASEIVSLRQEVKGLRDELTTELNRRTADKWTRADMRLWGSELSVLNSGKLVVPVVAPPPHNP